MCILITINFCFQKKEKFLEIFTTKGSIKQENYLGKINYNNLKFIVYSSGLETDFSELKDPVAFLDEIKTIKY